MSVEQIYQQYIRILPTSEQQKLVKLISQGWIEPPDPGKLARKHHSIMELHGLGQEIWRDIDAQDYVDQLRSEWDK